MILAAIGLIGRLARAWLIVKLAGSRPVAMNLDINGSIGCRGRAALVSNCKWVTE
jgi:hypothetical protein